MFKKGGLLFESYGAPGYCGGPNQPLCCGTQQGQSGIPCNQIVLFPGGTVSPGNSVRIFDDVTTEALGETRNVPTGKQNVRTNADGTITVTLQGPLARSYWSALNDRAIPPTPTFENFHSGGVGVNGSGAFSADSANLVTAFGDAYVEIFTTATPTSSTGNGDLPFLSDALINFQTGLIPTLRFAKTWFGKCISGQDWVCEQPKNHFHVLGIYGPSETNWGKTISDRSNSSYVYIGQIEGKCKGQTTSACKKFVTVHEIGHQFDVNPCDCLGHDTNGAWCAGNGCGPADEQCVMYSSALPQRQDGIDRFDVLDLLYGTLVPKSEICEGGVVLNCDIGDGSIRVASDDK